MGSVLGSILGTNTNYSASPYASALSPQEGVDQYLQDLNNKAAIGANQNSLAQALQQQMMGQGPNPAQTQFMGNVQNNIANAQGMIASQRGLNPALAARMGSNIAANANQQGALGSALLQQQQQLGATSNLGNLYSQQQQANLGYLGQQNGINQNANQFNYGVSSGNADRNAQIAGGLINSIGGGTAAKAIGKAHGGYIEGKAKVPGDSPKNDTVNAKLSPGEIVIPRSAAHDPEKAKEFIDHLLKSKKKSNVGYGDVVAARRKRKAA